MKTVVFGFNYVEYTDQKKVIRQDVAIQIMSQLPHWIFPISLGFCDNPSNKSHYGLTVLNLLTLNSRHIIGNDRDLPYAKEIFDICSKVECGKIGYVNSDILLGQEFIETIQEPADAFIFSRKDTVETSPSQFKEGLPKIIFGGDQHIGVDGFFFGREWWINNRDFFPDDLIIGETEWDTCYRTIIKGRTKNYVEKRVLYHVYHDAKWTLTSPGAKNNIRIWENIRAQYQRS